MSDTLPGLSTGDIMIGPIGGIVPGLFPVGVGQGALFLTRRWWQYVRTVKRWWRFRHAAVITNGGNMMVQAMPRGCELVPIGARAHDSRNLFIRPDYALADVSPAMVGAFALTKLGTPYNFLTYLKLAAGALRMPLTERLLRRWISTRADMMCSQHVDQALADAGYHVFDDGRLPQDVVPAELALALLARPGWFMIPGHPRFGQWTDTKAWLDDKPL